MESYESTYVDLCRTDYLSNKYVCNSDGVLLEYIDHVIIKSGSGQVIACLCGNLQVIHFICQIHVTQV